MRPDVEASLWVAPERCGSGAHTAVHQLLPQVVDLGLKPAVLYNIKHASEQISQLFQVKQAISALDIWAFYHRACTEQ